MTRGTSRGLAVIATAIAVACQAASAAWAEVGAPDATVQAVAADAQFLEYAPPPAAPGVVCLVDSGVDPNPDTSPILAGSYALEPGTDTADELSKVNPPVQPGNHPDGHGTYMAMIMAAPANGWGMVGIAPTSVRVFNVKTLAAGQASFSFGAYGYAINQCIDKPLGISGISVINLSLGSASQPPASDVQDFEDTVGEARVQGFNVVAAAGNDAGTVLYPAAASGVLGVGATNANPSSIGVLCPFSDRGSALSVLAPGCGTQSEPSGGGDGIDVAFSDDGSRAWSYGTSDASAVVSSVLASLRAYDPNITAEQAGSCITSTLVDGGNLDAAAAFRACGLGAVVDQGMVAYARATARQESAVQTAPAQSNLSRAPAPTVTAPRWATCPRVTEVRFEHGALTVSVTSVPAKARLRLDVERAVSHHRFVTVASTTTALRHATVKVRRWSRAALLFVRSRVRSLVAHIVPRKTATGISRTQASVCGPS